MITSSAPDVLFARAGVAFGNLTPDHVPYSMDSPRGGAGFARARTRREPADVGVLLGHLHLIGLGCPPPVPADLVEGVEAWLAGRLAARRGEWRGWLAAVLTTWAATVYDTVIGGLRLPVDAQGSAPPTGGDRIHPVTSCGHPTSRPIRAPGACWRAGESRMHEAGLARAAVDRPRCAHPCPPGSLRAPATHADNNG